MSYHLSRSNRFCSLRCHIKSFLLGLFSFERLSDERRGERGVSAQGNLFFSYSNTSFSKETICNWSTRIFFCLVRQKMSSLEINFVQQQLTEMKSIFMSRLATEREGQSKIMRHRIATSFFRPQNHFFQQNCSVIVSKLK